MAFPADYPIMPIHPSPIVKWSNGNLTAKRQFKVPTAVVGDFIEDLLSTGGNACGLPGTFPGWPLVFISNIEATPMSPCAFVSPGGDGYITNPLTELEGYPSDESEFVDYADGSWPWSKVVVDYTTREVLAGQTGVREGTWVSYDRNMSGSFITLPNRNVFFQTIGEQCGNHIQVHKYCPTADITLTWQFVDEDDMCYTETNLLTMQGKVNNAAWGGFLFPGICSDMFPAETLAFTGYSTTLELGTKSIFGTYCTAVEKKRNLKLGFKYKRVFGMGSSGVIGWNHEYYDGNLSPPGWYRIVDESGNPRYELATFTNIFL